MKMIEHDYFICHFYWYLRHILVWIFSPFWLLNLIFGGIPKGTKKLTNSQCFKYELVG